MSRELCGQPTASGLPCTMPRGHRVHYHRHRGYESITWEIVEPNGTLIESGQARIALNYAIAAALKLHTSITVTINKLDTLNDVDQSLVTP